LVTVGESSAWRKCGPPSSWPKLRDLLNARTLSLLSLPRSNRSCAVRTAAVLASGYSRSWLDRDVANLAQIALKRVNTSAYNSIAHTHRMKPFGLYRKTLSNVGSNPLFGGRSDCWTRLSGAAGQIELSAQPSLHRWQRPLWSADVSPTDTFP
jgi:hypothetical protein